MIITTFNDAPLALFLLPPDWNDPVTLDLTLPAQTDRSFSGKESRRAFAESMRYTLGYSAAPGSLADSETLRLWLRQVRDQLVAVPLWCDQVQLAADTSAGAGTLNFSGDTPARWGTWWIISDGTNYELLQVTALAGTTLTLAVATAHSWSAATAWIAPLLFGKLAARPPVAAETDALATVKVSIKESSNWDYRLTPQPVALSTVGAGVPALSALKLLTVRPDWSKVEEATELDQVEELVGFLREEQRRVYTAPVRRGLTYSIYTADRSEIAQVEKLWTDRLGPVRLFMAPTWRSDLQLTADVAAGAGALSIAASDYTSEDFSDHPGHAYLALLDDEHIEPCQASDISPGTLTLEAVLTNAFKAAACNLSSLLLCRFADVQLSWSYDTDRNAAAELKLIEAPTEYAGPVDLPVPAFCYKFTINLPEVQNYRFTSHERPITLTDGTYNPAPFNHKGGKGTGKIDDDTLELDSWNFSGNPLALFLPFSLEKPLLFELREADADDPGAGTLIYKGEVKDCEPVGDKLKATVQSVGQILERRFPGFFRQSSCNYCVYSVPCGVIADDYKLDVNLGSTSDGQTLVITGVSSTGFSENFFAGGYFISGTGAALIYRDILSSTASVSGADITLVLNRPMPAWTVGQAIQIYPGCDGQTTTCKNVFNNYINFGGHPFVPDQNPTLNAVPINPSNAGKK